MNPPSWWLILGEAIALVFSVIFGIGVYQEVVPIFWAHEWGPASMWFHFFLGNILFVVAFLFLIGAACGLVGAVEIFFGDLADAIIARKRKSE